MEEGATRNVYIDGKFLEEWIEYRKTRPKHDRAIPLIDARITLARKFAFGGAPMDEDCVIIHTEELPDFPEVIPEPTDFDRFADV